MKHFCANVHIFRVQMNKNKKALISENFMLYGKP